MSFLGGAEKYVGQFSLLWAAKISPTGVLNLQTSAGSSNPSTRFEPYFAI